MTLRSRIVSKAAALGATQQVPRPSWFRTNATGRWPSDPFRLAHAPAYLHRRHPDGTVDLIGLEPDGEDWLEAPGAMARDFAARQPR